MRTNDKRVYDFRQIRDVRGRCQVAVYHSCDIGKFDDVWSFGGKALPEHVCRYVLGVYYEINYKRKSIRIEYYRKGRMVKSRIVDLCAVCRSAKLASASTVVREI